MIRLFVLLMALATPIAAETVKVVTGEHETFTRLVLELPEAGDWRLGRTATGYEFTTVAGSPPRYDLTTVWDRIPKSRLQAIFADPETGRLRLTLACACHAFPFEYQPGMVVIDLRDGPAPPGSVFEAALDAAVPSDSQVADIRVSQPKPGTYDWLAAPPPTRLAADPAPEMPLPSGAVSLAPLRDALLQEISRGAAEGIVDMTGPPPAVPAAAKAEVDLPWSRIVIGEMPGVLAGPDRKSPNEMQADGAACTPDATLAIADWASEAPAAQQLAAARAGLMEEFDLPDPQAIRHAVRTHLALGFGAEALQYLGFLDQTTDPDLAIYASMARIIDGQDDPASPLGRMLACDTAAALWAALLHDRLPAGSGVNTNAVLRSFSALPAHLRRLFGPELAERFLLSGNAEAARMLRDATARAPDMALQDLDLVDARSGLANGRAEEAANLAEAALNGGAAAGMAAVITLVEARFALAEPITPDLLATVQSYQLEAAGTPTEAGLQRALALALALSGQPSAALEAARPVPDTLADVWRAISLRATDAQLIDVAVLPDGAETPQVAGEVALGLAARLTDLGFADAALAWLDRSADAAPGFALAAARAELLRSDAGAALALLDGESGTEAEGLRAQALERLGQLGPAAEAWRAAGDAAQAGRLAAWRRDWAGVSPGDTAPWADAAGLAVARVPGTGPEEDGLLARGSALVEDSASARRAIETLLAAVPAP